MNKEGQVVLAKCSDCKSINKIAKDRPVYILYTYLPQIKRYIGKFQDYIKHIY